MEQKPEREQKRLWKSLIKNTPPGSARALTDEKHCELWGGSAAASWIPSALKNLLEFTPVPTAEAGHSALCLPLQWERPTATPASLQAGRRADWTNGAFHYGPESRFSELTPCALRRPSGQKYLDKHRSFSLSRAADLFQVSIQTARGTVRTSLQQTASPLQILEFISCFFERSLIKHIGAHSH